MSTGGGPGGLGDEVSHSSPCPHVSGLLYGLVPSPEPRAQLPAVLSQQCRAVPHRSACARRGSSAGGPAAVPRTGWYQSKANGQLHAPGPRGEALSFHADPRACPGCGPSWDVAAVPPRHGAWQLLCAASVLPHGPWPQIRRGAGLSTTPRGHRCHLRRATQLPLLGDVAPGYPAGELWLPAPCRRLLKAAPWLCGWGWWPPASSTTMPGSGTSTPQLGQGGRWAWGCPHGGVSPSQAPWSRAEPGQQGWRQPGCWGAPRHGELHGAQWGRSPRAHQGARQWLSLPGGGGAPCATRCPPGGHVAGSKDVPREPQPGHPLCRGKERAAATSSRGLGAGMRGCVSGAAPWCPGRRALPGWDPAPAAGWGSLIFASELFGSV